MRNEHGTKVDETFGRGWAAQEASGRVRDDLSLVWTDDAWCIVHKTFYAHPAG